jgi:hypothetical protein
MFTDENLAERETIRTTDAQLIMADVDTIAELIAEQERAWTLYSRVVDEGGGDVDYLLELAMASTDRLAAVISRTFDAAILLLEYVEAGDIERAREKLLTGLRALAAQEAQP